ncbi:MAG: response regulator [Desulfobacteraceae bacterium]|nr:response regulator [Desulfobacteraceae bacterium]
MKQDNKGAVLVVDNDPGSLEALVEHLEQAGFRIFIAENGTSALRSVEHVTPDIILMDVELPDTDGFELCRRVKEYHKNIIIPVIFLTALTDITNKIREFEPGAVDCITKPFHPEEVVARVEKHLTLRNLQNRLKEQNEQLQKEIAERMRTEAALQESETRYKAIISAIPDTIFRMNRDGFYLECNATSDDMLAIPKDELIGKNIGELGFPAEFVEQAIAFVRKTLDSGRIQIFEYKLELKGRVQEHEARIVPLAKEEVLVIVRNITERKKAEQAVEKEKQRLFDVLDTLPAFVCIHAPDYSMPFVNRKFRDLFGNPDSRPCYEILQKKQEPCKICPTLNVFNTKKSVVWEWTDNNGRTYMVHDSLFPDPGGKELVLEVGIDITDRKQTENDLEKAREAAEAANQTKSIFLANMSHEFRTPLNIISGYTQILQQSTKSTPKIRNGLESISQSASHLLTLINDILDISKIGTKEVKLDCRELYFSQFLNKLAEITRIRAREKHILFRHEQDHNLPVIIEADEKRLRQVLLNLLGNAVKFAETGTITFRIRCFKYQAASEEKAVRIRFEVEDTGVGIKPEQLEKIFLPFEQVRNAEQWHEGTGTGLAISSHIVSLMGGKIKVISRFGKGSTFWFEAVFPMISGPAGDKHTNIEENKPDAWDIKTKIIPPPLEQLEILYEMAMLGVMERIEQHADNLEEKNSKYIPFSDQLRKFANNYEDEKLMLFITGYVNRAKENL